MDHCGYGECPNCKHRCWTDDSGGDEPNLLTIKNRRHVSTDYGPGENWTEVYQCPKCGQVFEERNGYP